MAFMRQAAHRIDVALVHHVPHHRRRAVVRALHGTREHRHVGRPGVRVHVVQAVRRRNGHGAAHQGGAAAVRAAADHLPHAQDTPKVAHAGVVHLLRHDKTQLRLPYHVRHKESPSSISKVESGARDHNVSASH